jgi:hypothetical protein
VPKLTKPERTIQPNNCSLLQGIITELIPLPNKKSRHIANVHMFQTQCADMPKSVGQLRSAATCKSVQKHCNNIAEH